MSTGVRSTRREHFAREGHRRRGGEQRGEHAVRAHGEIDRPSERAARARPRELCAADVEQHREPDRAERAHCSLEQFPHQHTGLPHRTERPRTPPRRPAPSRRPRSGRADPRWWSPRIMSRSDVVNARPGMSSMMVSDDGAVRRAGKPARAQRRHRKGGRGTGRERQQKPVDAQPAARAQRGEEHGSRRGGREGVGGAAAEKQREHRRDAHVRRQLHAVRPARAAGRFAHGIGQLFHGQRRRAQPA